MTASAIWDAAEEMLMSQNKKLKQRKQQQMFALESKRRISLNQYDLNSAPALCSLFLP